VPYASFALLVIEVTEALSPEAIIEWTAFISLALVFLVFFMFTI
jgi:hypothetical protein